MSKSLPLTKAESVTLGRIIARLFRPQNTRLSLLLYTVVAVYMGAAWEKIILGGVLIVFCYGVVTAYNDIHDLAIDQYNKRDLPLATGELTARQARRVIAGAVVIIAVLQTGLVQPFSLIFTLLYLGLGWIYSAPHLRVADRELWAPILLSMCYATLPFMLALTLTAHAGGPEVAGIQVAGLIIAATLFSVVALLFKDFKDLTGDEWGNKHTPLIRYGAHGIKIIAWVITLAGALVLYSTTTPYLGWIVALGVGLVALMNLTSQIEPNPRWVRVYSYASLLAVILALIKPELYNINL